MHTDPSTPPYMPTPAPVCEVCGTTAATIFYPAAQEYLCPQHSASRALSTVAQAHLITLLNGVIGQWAQHWGQTGATATDIAEALELAAHRTLSVDYADHLARVRDLLETEEG